MDEGGRMKDGGDPVDRSLMADGRPLTAAILRLDR
jgi:hypothetical protein